MLSQGAKDAKETLQPVSTGIIQDKQELKPDKNP
jgi:hypothetical protein